MREWVRKGIISYFFGIQSELKKDFFYLVLEMFLKIVCL